MYRKTSILLPALLAALLVCGIISIFPVNEMPSLSGYSRVVLVFYADNTSEKYERLPTLLSCSIGAELSSRYKDKEWFFDHSERIHPVSDKMRKIGIRPCDICQDHRLATKLANELQADLIIAGRIEEPGFIEEGYREMEYGTSRTSQAAILNADFKVIDPKVGQAIWCGRMKGYKEYRTSYSAGDQILRRPEESMLYDVERDLVEEVLGKLCPAMTALEG